MAKINGNLTGRLVAKQGTLTRIANSATGEAEDLEAQAAEKRASGEGAAHQAEGIGKALRVLADYGVTGI